MKRDSTLTVTPRPPGERSRLLREYFLNALTLALMKEAGTLGAPVRVAPRRRLRAATPS